jgi:hypothetical protein
MSLSNILKRATQVKPKKVEKETFDAFSVAAQEFLESETAEDKIEALRSAIELIKLNK